MERNYYNKVAFSKALKLMQSDPFQAEIEFREYTRKYPEDYYAMSIYVSLLITVKKIDLAEQLLDELESNVANDRHFAKEVAKQYETSRSIFYSKIKLLSWKGQFRELYDYFLFHPTILETFNIDGTILYCKKKLGIPYTMKDINDSYIIRQIINYNETEMKNHIKKHLADNNVDEQQSACVFSADFPMEKIIEEIKKYLPSEKRLCCGLYDEHYIFEFESCGKVDRKTTNYFEVVCFANTSDIITIYPTMRGKKIPHVDLNYMKDSDLNDKPKVKVMSQRDKFYKRYEKTDK